MNGWEIAGVVALILIVEAPIMLALFGIQLEKRELDKGAK